ncbi:MAG: TPM domain-containing protein [Desulfobacterales bacterium]|nr:TPM domain-containing protein [Desulfobacterales bacterium]
MKNFCISILVAGLILGCSGKDASNAFIDDRAGILTDDETRRISTYYEKLFQKLDIHLKVTVLKEGTSDIDQVAIDLFDEYNLGENTRGANGVLMVIDPHGGQVRMEVGYDLEGIFTDIFIGRIERDQMVPFFRTGKVGPGIEATVELIVAKAFGVIDDAGYISDEEKPVLDNWSGGAGAKTDVKIGSEGIRKESLENAEMFGSRPTPQLTLEVYMAILENHIKDPHLEVYTPETRKFFEKWLVTDGQQDNELRDLIKCKDDGKLYEEGNLAVIRFSVNNRQCAPYFFRKGENGWMLDFASLSRMVGFNHLNQWHFRSQEHEFMFAFSDLTFDKNGFPHQ